MRLVQYLSANNDRRVAVVSADGTTLQPLANTNSVRELALEAHSQGIALADLARRRAGDARQERR